MKKTSRIKPRKRICPPPPTQSDRIYVRVAPAKIGMFRFLLEAYENLGIFTVTNKFKGILLLRYSPHQKREIQAFIKAARTEMDIQILPLP